jgi:hypothetical protein
MRKLWEKSAEGRSGSALEAESQSERSRPRVRPCSRIPEGPGERRAERVRVSEAATEDQGPGSGNPRRATRSVSSPSHNRPRVRRECSRLRVRRSYDYPRVRFRFTRYSAASTTAGVRANAKDRETTQRRGSDALVRWGWNLWGRGIEIGASSPLSPESRSAEELPPRTR